ncbi:MAG: RHS repeat-associated core domain-containing protein [Opitutales bacterium]
MQPNPIARTGFSYLTTVPGVNVDETDIEAAPFIRLRSGGATPDRQGKPYDEDLQAHVFPYRNYSSALGRWTSADPLGFPDGPNRHFYAPVPTVGLDPLGLDVYLTSHSVASSSSGGSSGAPTGGPGFQHSSIFGQPDNPSQVSNMPPPTSSDPSVTVAAGTYSSSAGPEGGNLAADFNRPTDIDITEQTNHGEILPTPGMTDTEFNEAIITATENYMQNTTNNPLDYDAGAGTLPGSMGDGYNSNSFIGSLLRHLGAQLPAGFDSSMFPGWDVDIPPGEL